MDASSGQVFLFIGGGRWKPEYENGFQGALPRQALIFAKLAETLRAPVAVLAQVPYQPMFDRREDALIAYTFDHYLETGEPDWPLLLPMVKSAARAMDAVQAFARERWQLPVNAFTVAGVAKRRGEPATSSGCASENAPLTRRPGAFELGSVTVSVASPALETTVAVVDAV